MKDLQTFFEELAKVKEVLDQLMHKLEDVSALAAGNHERSVKSKAQAAELTEHTAKLESTLAEVDGELQK